MGSKTTKTGVPMKWLMCASIYAHLFGMLNSNKLYLLAFFIFKLLYGIYLICKCTLRISSHSPIFFIKLLCSGMQEYRNMYSLFNAKSSLMCVFKFFSEITETTEDKDHHGIGEKIHSNDLGQLYFILISSASGGGGF